MEGQTNEAHDVVVVGAGGAGLTAATALARAGVDVLLLERRPVGLPLPRATVLSVRTMELMRSWGLEQRVREGADRVEMTLLETPTAARAAEGLPINVGYPSTAQSAVISPTEALCVAQDHLEAVLLEHLATLASITVRRGVRVVEVRAGAPGEGATLTIRDADGRNRTIEARYVVAADGARSVVRSALGVTMTGPDALMGGVTTEFRAPLWEVLGEHRHLLYSLTEPGGDGTLLPAGQGDRWMLGLQQDYHFPAEAPPSPEEIHERIRRGIGVPGVDVRIERFSWFTSGAQMAETFGVGDVFLVGDAAHRVTPRGGTGLNIAIADGRDLGWRLAWVLRGWAPPTVLSSYEIERRPAVAHNVARSADPFGSRRDVSTELAVDLGGRVPHVWVEPDGRSTLDLVGPGLTLFTDSANAAWSSAAADPALEVPTQLAALTPLAARSLGVGAAGATLVRPDGRQVAAWQTAHDAHARLRAAVADLLEGDDVREPVERDVA